jgi:methionyl-tRNA formyltransferase
LRIIFAGTPENAATTLEALLISGLNVVGVLTREDAPIGRKRLLTPSAVAKSAAKFGLATKKANLITPEVEQWILGLEPEIGVVVAYGSILKKSSLTLPTHGWINLHYSLLPRLRGPAPVQFAILNGMETTGVTVFRLDEGIDSGPILASRSFPIGKDDTAGMLLGQLTQLGTNLLIHTLQDFHSLAKLQVEQELPKEENLTRKITRSQARIDFRAPAAVVHNLIRAMNPEPMAFFTLDRDSVRVLESSPVEVSDLAVGELSEQAGELLVGCGNGAVQLKRLQPAGKNPMSGADWFRGLRDDGLRLS